MKKLLLAYIMLFVLMGCTTASEVLIGEPIYSRLDSSDMLWENFIVYGKLRKEVLREPTDVYQSSFGHAYCMSEEITYEVLGYIQGSGPSFIEFTQNKIDSCRPIADDIGFGKSILFLSKNKYRGIWVTGSLTLNDADTEPRIVSPSDILQLSVLDNFGDILTDHEEPSEWKIEKGFESKDDLEKLKEKGILEFELIKDESGREFYMVKIYKYIRIKDLLRVNSGGQG